MHKVKHYNTIKHVILQCSLMVFFLLHVTSLYTHTSHGTNIEERWICRNQTSTTVYYNKCLLVNNEILCCVCHYFLITYKIIVQNKIYAFSSLLRSHLICFLTVSGSRSPTHTQNQQKLKGANQSELAMDQSGYSGSVLVR